MKKTILTLAIVLGFGLTSIANPNNGGLFQRGEDPQQSSGFRSGGAPVLPQHGQEGNQNAPIGTGIAIITALGAAYLVGKHRKQK